MGTTFTGAAGTIRLSGSVLGSDTYVFGGNYGDAQASLSTYATTTAKAGSTLQGTATAAAGTVLASGSTIGGTVTVASAAGAAVTLTADMTAKAGSVLKFVAGANNTMFKAGTQVTQDMVLDTANTGAGTDVSVKAGDVLTTDLFLNLNTDITLSADMMLKKDSVIGTGSQLATNTANAGTVGLSSTKVNQLSTINVLTSEGAQAAISIADSALKNVDRTRASLGAVQNQLSSTLANLSVTQTNVNVLDVAFRYLERLRQIWEQDVMSLASQAPEEQSQGAAPAV